MASATTIEALAAQFPTSDREAWAALALRTLKGAPLGSLTRRTLEGLEIQPLYEGAADPVPLGRDAPGWEVRTLIAAPDPAAANAEALDDLAQGADSLLVRLGDQAGGLSASPGELARALEGVLIDAAPVALDASFATLTAAAELDAAAKGAPAARLAFHLDPLRAFAERGSSPGPIEAHLDLGARLAPGLAESYPRASLFLASGQAVHEAGGGEAAELAVALAAAIAYARALDGAGFDRAEAFERIVIGLAVDADYVLSLAKLRAARLLWAKAARACGTDAPARIEARSSGRMLTRADPWTNMIRLTVAAFAGAVGGADAIVLGCYTDALGPPSAFARRQSRNIQLVLKEEAGLGRIDDPAAGSGCIEALTPELARAAWTRLRQIETAGGLAEALKAGLVARFAEEGRAELKARIARRELKILGVSDHPPAEERPVELGASPKAPPASDHAPRPPGPDSRCPALAPIRLEDLV